MTGLEWGKLKAGDVIVHKRAAGIELRVVVVTPATVTVENSQGRHDIKRIPDQWTNCQRKFPRIPLKGAVQLVLLKPNGDVA